MITRRLCTIILMVVSMLLTACGTTPPTRFYTLSAEAVAQTASGSNGSNVVVGIGPVEVAPYLERTQIVTRTGQTRLKLTEFDRWAEPIENNIANVLAVNLSRLLPATQPIIRPWADAGAEYHVLVKILRFDSDSAGNVQLDASWGIQSDSTRSMPVIRDASISQPSAGEDYEAITKTMSVALVRLSEQIASELGRVIKGQ